MKITYDKNDSVLIRECMKIALGQIEKIKPINGEQETKRIREIVQELKDADKKQEISSSSSPINCEDCDI
tara:strand:+ start:4598 stop:4807 length:210 start_codon:yes stop_codon:yes gene_type:complete